MGIAGVGVAAIAGTAISAYGAYSAGQAQSANAKYQAQVAKNNQTIANQNADYATQAGQEQATEASQKARAQGASLKAAQAANGLDINTGSAVDVQESQRETGTLNTATVLNNAMLRAYGYRTQGVNYGAQATLDTTEAGQASTAGDLSALGTLAGGAKSSGLFTSGGTPSGGPGGGQG
jgi:hypothetical protein